MVTNRVYAGARKNMTTGRRIDLPPCEIYIDKEGEWFHRGLPMIHREFIHLFYQNLELDSEGTYIISWKGARCYVEVEDTAFVVRRASLDGNQAAGGARFVLSLSDDTREELRPETLFVGKENVLYGRVKEGRFPARFNRAAYYELAAHVEEEEGRFFLPLNGAKYPIPCRPV